MTLPLYHASGGLLIRKGRGNRTVPTVSSVGPISVADVNELEQHLSAPLPDKNYVPWTWPTGTSLFTVSQSLGANDVLVLPEDDAPVARITAMDTQTLNGSAVTDRAGVRLPSMVGLGPNARVEFAPDLPSYAARGTSEGARDAMIECWNRTLPIFANFTIRGRYIGGLAFHCIKMINGDNGRAERLRTLNHYGYQNFEPGETFGLLIQGHDAGTFTTWRNDVDGRNPDTGLKEGSGGIHLVDGLNVVLNGDYVHHVRGAGVASYSRRGTTTMNSLLIERPGGLPSRDDLKINGSGVNIEVCGPNGFTLNDCTILMYAAETQNTRHHISIVSTATQGDVGNWPLGKTPVTVNRPIGETTFRIGAAAADGATYHSATVLENRSTITVTGANPGYVFV